MRDYLAYDFSITSINEKCIIDLRYSASPLVLSNYISISNKSMDSLYFKMTIDNSDYSIISPASGNLDVVGTGGTSVIYFSLNRAKPSVETIEVVDITISAYTDSGYTLLVGSSSIEHTIYMEDYSDGSWTNTSYTFDTDADGFTLSNLAWSSSYNLTGSGGCLYGVLVVSDRTGHTEIQTATKSITLPTADKIRIGCYIGGRYENTLGTSGVKNGYVAPVKITLDSVDIVYLYRMFSQSGFSTTNYGWYNLIADASTYSGQSKTLSIYALMYAYESATTNTITVSFVIDNVEIFSKS